MTGCSQRQCLIAIGRGFRGATCQSGFGDFRAWCLRGSVRWAKTGSLEGSVDPTERHSVFAGYLFIESHSSIELSLPLPRIPALLAIIEHKIDLSDSLLLREQNQTAAQQLSKCRHGFN